MSDNDTRESIPAHVGIIMDGNGRWAKRRGLARAMGHRQGAEVFGKIARHAAVKGVKCLTVYAFSTENWKRPADEVDGIMDLLRRYLNDTKRYSKDNMRLRALGDVSVLPADIRGRIDELERNSRGNTGMELNIAINYGGRAELLRAAKELARLYTVGEVKRLDEFDEAAFAGLLYTAGQPDVDLVIRTGGEQRVSNFLPWQSAYAEYYFTDAMWPDFTPRMFDSALEEYARRARRLGGV